MSDASVRNANAGGQRMADALLRATGGYTALLLIPSLAGDGTDAGQLGLDAPNFQELALSPVTFRRTRAVMVEGQPAKYELVISATAVEQQVVLLQLDSAEALLGLVAGVNVAGLGLLVEAWSCSVSLGQPVLYRLLLRAAETASLVSEGA